MSANEMQPEKQPQGYASPKKQEGGLPGVEGMTVNMGFGQGGSVTLTVEITQNSTFDDSSGYSVTGAIGTANGSTAQMETMGGVAPYTANEDFDASLTYAGTNAATLSGSIDSGSVSPGPSARAITLSGSSQSVDGTVRFGSNGQAAVSLDLTSDASITRTSDAFTVEAGATSADQKINVTELVAVCAFTPGVSFTASVEYTDGNGDTQLFSATCPARDVVAGTTVNEPLASQ